MTRQQLAQLDDDLSLETTTVDYLDLHGERTSEFYCSSFSVEMDGFDNNGVDCWGNATFSIIEI